MSSTLAVQDVIFAGGQRATARRAVDVSMETLASVWAGALHSASEPRHAACDLTDVQYEYDYSGPQPSRTPSMSPHLQKNKQLQDTLQQREEEVVRLQEENNKLRRFLNSAFITNLEKTKKLPSDARSKLKRGFLQCDDSRTLQNPGATSLRKRVCRNLLPELCAASGPNPSAEEGSEELDPLDPLPDPLDLWVLRTLGLKDRDTIDTSALPPPSPSGYGRDRWCKHPRSSSDDGDVTSLPGPVLSSSCEYGVEAAISYACPYRHASPSSDYPLCSPFTSSSNPPPPLVCDPDDDYCRAPGGAAAPAFNHRAAADHAVLGPETDMMVSLPANCLDAPALNVSVQDHISPLDGCPNLTNAASADRCGVNNVSVTDNYRPAAGCKPAASQRDGEIQSTLTPPTTALISDRDRSPDRRNPGGYSADQSPSLQRSNGSRSQFTHHSLSPVLSSSPEQFCSPLPHNDNWPRPEFTLSSPQTLTASAAVSLRADHPVYQSPRLQRDIRSPSQETVAFVHSPQTCHRPPSLTLSPVVSTRRIQSPLERFGSNEHCHHPPTGPTGGAAALSTQCPAQNLPRSGTDVAFSMSLSPSSSVKTHSFPQGQAFVKRDTQGQWRFTWVPTQGP